MPQKKSTAWEIVNRLESSGELKILSQVGFCNQKAINDMEIARRVGAKTHTGQTVSKAVGETAVDFRICNRTVYRALQLAKVYGKKD